MTNPHTLQDEPFDFDTQEGLDAGFREGWRQAMNGETISLAEMWDAPKLLALTNS